MSQQQQTVLLVEDDVNHVELIRRTIAGADASISLKCAANLKTARRTISEISPDIIIVDYKLPDGLGTDLLPGNPDEFTVPIIVMTSYGDERIAVEAMKKGALDYIVKSETSFLELPRVIKRALWEWGLLRDRKFAEQKLRESEERVRTFIETAEDMVYFQNLDGSVSLLNDAAYRLTGYSEEEFAANPNLMMEIVHPQDKQAFLSHISQPGDFATSVQTEYRLRHKSGDWRWLQSRKVGLKDAAGEYAGFNCIDRDITERKLAEVTTAQINECFLALGPDALANIELLTENCGRIMGGTCALYNRLENDMLCSWGRWNIPDDIKRTGDATGRLCYQVITKNIEIPITVHDLQSSPYAEITPHIRQLNLRTYFGRAVRLDDNSVGSLCVLFDRHFEPTETQIGQLNIIAAAIGIEEKRRQVLHEIRKSEERLELALESAGLGLWDHHLKTGDVFRSSRWAEMLGYTPEEIEQRVENWHDLIHPDDLEEAIQAAEDHESGKTPVYRVEHRLRTKSGDYKWILNWGRIVEWDADGKPVRATGTHMDVTERKKSEEDLRQSEERYRGIVDNINIGIAVIDTDMRLMSMNAQMKAWFPNVKDKKTACCFEVLHSPARKEPCKYCPTSLSIQDCQVHEAVVKMRIAGDQRDIRLVSCPIRDRQGKPVAIIELLEDITDKLKIEEELVKAEKLESIGVLAGGIAHDFNNILTSILGNISLARIEAKDGLDISELLHEVELAAVRAKDLTQQLLTFSKGGAPIKKTASIPEIITESATFALRGSNVKVVYNIPDDLFTAEVDEGQISQVISNLVINAKQAMPGGGLVTITCENIESDPSDSLPVKPGKYIRIVIADEGTGIAERHLKKIFDPFFTTKQSGSGLGLATTYSIVRSHMGHIQADSTLGVGTMFTIYLPASNHSIKIDMASSQDIPKGAGKVLIVDDEQPVLRLANAVLTKLGYTAISVTDGREAIALYEAALHTEHPIDVVLLDLTIPGGMGGKETLDELKKIDPNVCAIVSSGYANNPLMASYKEHGFCGRVAKPYKAGQLGDAIKAVLKNKKNSIL
ncbi:MAG: PAS domain S-box protein [Candidatus Zixiibacteriota bacterium]